jgi:hypothetical protein
VLLRASNRICPSVRPQTHKPAATARPVEARPRSPAARWPAGHACCGRTCSVVTSLPLALSRIRSEAWLPHAGMLRDAATQGSDAAADSRAARSRDSQLPHTSNDQRAAMLGLRGRFASLCATRSPARIQAAVPARTFAADKPTHPEGITHRISTYFMPQVLLASRRPSSPPATVAGCIQRRT